MIDLIVNVFEWVEHLIVVIVVIGLIKKIRQEGFSSIVESISSLAVSAIKVVPGGAARLQAEQDSIIAQLESVSHGPDDPHKNYALPKQGVAPEVLTQQLVGWREQETDFRMGRAFGGIYCVDHQHEEFVNKIYALYSSSNALYPGVFPGLRKFEAEIVQMTASLFNGSSSVCGTMTSGGTESILMAVKANREYFRKHRPHIRKPNIVLAQSAHAAFAKACYYFGVEHRMVPSGEETGYAIDVEALKRAIDANTILIVASAPSFPHGVIDPVEELGRLALQHGIGLHVDCCLGGYLLPFLKKLGHVRHNFDFSVPGVTSISADIHKYGYGPKGTSVILHSTAERRKCQFFKYTEWSGGIYCSPSMTGSRSGGIIAAAWATLMSLGEQGYLDQAARQYQVWSLLVEELPKIPGLRLLGPPHACVVAFTSADPAVDIMKVADALSRRHWQANRLQKPLCLQLQIGVRQDFAPQEFLKDLAESFQAVRERPGDFEAGLAGIYTMAANLPNRALVGSLMEDYLGTLYKV